MVDTAEGMVTVDMEDIVMVGMVTAVTAMEDMISVVTATEVMGDMTLMPTMGMAVTMKATTIIDLGTPAMVTTITPPIRPIMIQATTGLFLLTTVTHLLF